MGDIVHCQFNKEVQVAGGAVSALLKLPNGVKIAVQASGHVQADARWSRAAPEVVYNGFQRQTSQPLENKIKIPRVPLKGKDHCIFITPQKTFSMTNDTMLLVHFDIPRDAIPSFRGLLATTMYYLTVSVIDTESDGVDGAGEGGPGSAETKSVLHFPFWVSGRGSTDARQFVRFSDILVHPKSSFPAEHCFLPSGASSSSSDATPTDDSLIPCSGGARPVSIYTIRDEGIVCQVTCPQEVSPGTSIQLILDLSNAEQTCVGVRTRLFLREARTDGSPVQDKVIATTQNMTADAICVRQRLDLPTDAACTFATPLQKVEYRLDFEFLTRSPRTSGSCSDDSSPNELLWSTALLVRMRAPTRSNRASLMSCLEPARTAFLASQKCMPSGQAV